MNTINSKIVMTAGKFFNSKAYKTAEKIALAGSSAAIAVGSAVTNVMAVDGTGGINVTVDTASVLQNANPFINPAVTVLCVVGGIRIGWGFLKRAFH